MMASFPRRRGAQSTATIWLAWFLMNVFHVCPPLGAHVDAKLADICRQKERALVTLDVDFANMQAYPPADYSGLVVLRLRRQDKPHVLEVVASLLPVLRAEPVAQRLWIVDEARIRIRS
jgi:predicted nuclease of predicted toxin-antitoxin system